MAKRIALITGATSGIGLATAKLLAENDFNLILCGRRKERLTNLKAELSAQCEVLTLSFDVRERKVVEEIFSSLDQKWRNIDVLVNNAGNAHGFSSIEAGSVDDWDAMIDINVKGLLYISKSVLPGMVERKAGHVVNIGSIAGKEVYPNGAVYCASKYAVDAINTGMLLDLHKHNIKVTGINPGLVETEFSEVRFKGDLEKAQNVYQGIDPLKAEDIAETLLFVLTRPAHVNIKDLVIFPTAQGSATIVNRS